MSAEAPGPGMRVAILTVSDAGSRGQRDDRSGPAVAAWRRRMGTSEEMAEVAALYGAPVVAMHWDRTWDAQTLPLPAMIDYFARTLLIADAVGLPRTQLILDPGFGFSKTLAQNYQILRLLPELVTAYPDHGVLVGTSRKSMIGKLLDNLPDERLPGTIATSVQGYERGGHIFRVHDVAANRDALRVAQATLYGP